MALNMSTGLAALLLGPHAFDDIFRDGAIEIRTGVQPANADAAATGALLGRVTRDGGSWVAGAPANGLRWYRDGRFALTHPDQRWVLTGLDSGIAGWFRIVGNAYDSGGASLSLPRIDGAVAAIPADDDPPGDAQIFLLTTSLSPAISQPFDSVWFALPPLE